MATVPVRQASFVGGEIAEGLWARTNLKRYPESMRLLRNMIPLQEGPATNRPGLLYKGSALVDTGTARLIPFIYSSGSLARNYVLEFTAGKIRVWKEGVLQAVSIDTPYTDTDLPRLKVTQYGQVMTIFCKQKTPKLLTWTGDAAWALTDYAISRAISAPTGLAIPLAPPATETVAAREWEVVVTAVKAGTHEESLPSNVASATMAITSNTPARYTWDAVAGAEGYHIYRGRNGKFGLVGSAQGRVEFHDDGAYPVYAETPPTQRDPFPGADDMPQLGTYHDQRLVVANAWNNPGEVETTRMGEHKNFDRAVPPKASDAVTFNVSSGEYEEIRNLLSVDQFLLVMTNAREWMITGSEGVLMQDDIVFDRWSKWGSSWLDPLHIGNAVVFAQDVGSTVRELIPGNKQDGNDLTLLAQDLFRGYEIVSWCYAHEPFRQIWAVRSDGALLSCTYVRQHETWAWARHDTGGDKFEWICAIPENGENAVYALVKRYVGGVWKRYFERLAPRTKQALVNGVFLDSAITNTYIPPGGPGPYPGSTTVSGLTHLIGRDVYVLADGAPYGPFTVAGDGMITLTTPYFSRAHAGLRITAQGHTLDMYSSQEEVRPRKKLVKKVFMEVSGSRPFKAGQRLTDVLEQAVLTDGQPWTGVYTGIVQVSINCDWDSAGAVVWEHTDPTPLTILSVIREIEYGDR